MPTEKPLRPEGCVWGPWWDEGTKCWVCLVNDDRGLMILYWNGKIWFPSADHSRAHAELLRLAALNTRLVDGLELILPHVDCDMDSFLDVDAKVQKVKALIAEVRGEG